MKTKVSLQTTRFGPRNPPLCVWLWALVAGLPTAVLGQADYATPYTFTTLAGNADEFFGSPAEGMGSAARFRIPNGVAVDSAGNLYVADSGNNTIRKLTPVGTNCVVSTLATGFNYPCGVAVDSAGNVYVADTYNYAIRKITPAGMVTTVAGLAGSAGNTDGTGSGARFNGPNGVAVDSGGNVYVADTGNSTIRKVTPVGTNWVVSTLAGLAGSAGNTDGTGSGARFNGPNGVAVDSGGNVYVADTGNSTIRKVTPVGTNWVVTTPAGLAGSPGSADGAGTNAQFAYANGVAVDRAGNLYVADTQSCTIRKVTPVGGNWVVTTLVGLPGTSGSADGTGTNAQFWAPNGVAADSAGNVYVAEPGNYTIRKVTPVGTNWVVTTLAGLTRSTGSADGTGSRSRFSGPNGLAVDSAGNVYVADTGSCTIRKVTRAGMVTTLAGLAGSWGSADGTGTNAQFSEPQGAAVDSAGNLYVADTGNFTVRKVTPVGTNWVVTTLAGAAGKPGSADGTGTNAQFGGVGGVAVDSAGNVYVADTGSSTIRKVTSAGVVTTLAGGSWGSADGTGTNAQFGSPRGVAVDSAGNLYVADTGNFTVRKVTPIGTNWVVTTLAGTAGNSGSADGTGTNAQFGTGRDWPPWDVGPYGLAVDSAGNVYLADTANMTIRKVTPAGVVTTLAGLARGWGSSDGTGANAQFGGGGDQGGFTVFVGPRGVAVDSADNLYVADTYNNTIRKGVPASSVPPPILQPPSLSAGHFGFGITGFPNLAVNLEVSGDLSQWQFVGTYILEGGTNYVVSPNPPEGTQFYRGQLR